jgi:hypothetical protein
VKPEVHQSISTPVVKNLNTLKTKVHLSENLSKITYKPKYNYKKKIQVPEAQVLISENPSIITYKTRVQLHKNLSTPKYEYDLVKPQVELRIKHKYNYI